MSVFSRADFHDHEEVVFACDPKAGLRAIIAVHDSAPFAMAGGGCRICPYASDEDALDDVLRLSRAMTFKLALADLPAGGAKMVVIADPRRDKTRALLEAIGSAVERLKGRFIVGTDVGTSPEDMEIIATRTHFVSRKREGRDTGVATGHGVFLALRWAVRRHLGRDVLRGVRVAIQGVGRVGHTLARRLHDAGARLVIADRDEDAARRVAGEVGAELVAADAILSAEVDVFAPCALGGVIDGRTMESLRARVVAGGANNPLANDRLAGALAARGVLFVPDFVANLGGVIGASPAGDGGDEAEFLAPIGRVVEVLDAAAQIAERESIDLHAAAIRLAEERVAARKR